jgi:uncharacterized membrane protein YqhA
MVTVFSTMVQNIETWFAAEASTIIAFFSVNLQTLGTLLGVLVCIVIVGMYQIEHTRG